MKICGYANNSKVELENLYEVYSFVSDLQTAALARSCEFKVNRIEETTTITIYSKDEEKTIVIKVTAPEV